MKKLVSKALAVKRKTGSVGNGIDVNYKSTTVLKRPCLPDAETPMSRRYLALLQRWVPVGMQYFQEWPARPECGHFFGGLYFYGIETVNPLHTLASVISSPEYDPGITGYPREELVRTAVMALRYLCFTHDTGPSDCVRSENTISRKRRYKHRWLGPKWGERGKGFFPESQCGGTVIKLVESALILRQWLDGETWMMIARICADYLERFADMPPKSGIYNDTQAEENGWTAMGLAASLLFLERHKSAELWEDAAQRWMFCAAAAPDDMRDCRRFDRKKTVWELCGKTFAILPDFMAENHGIVHPSYTGAAISQAGSTVNLYRLFGKREPEHLTWHRRDIYENLKRMSDPNGILHPVQGMDWPYIRPTDLSGVHCFARLYLKDPDAAYYEDSSLGLSEKIIGGNGGRIIRPDVLKYCQNQQDPMIFWESHIGNLVSPYLAHRLCANERTPKPRPPARLSIKYAGVKVYPHSGFVFHRHDRGQTSFSWRNEIMVLPLTRDGLLTIAPSFGSVLGNIRVREFAQSRRLEFVHVHDRETGFAAVMRVLLHDASIRQDVLLASLPDGRLVCREMFRALKPCTVERIQQGYLEIVNEHFPALKTNCMGLRKLFSPGREHEFPSLVRLTAKDDGTVQFKSPEWLNLDDRMGIVMGSSGHDAGYHNRHFFKPYHAVSDELFLHLRERPSRYSANRRVSDILFMLCPEQHHDDTAKQMLVSAKVSAPGACGILAQDYLVLGNFDGAAGRCSFAFERSKEMPVFAGLMRVEKKRVLYEVDLLPGQCRYLEPLASIETDSDLTIAALPGGQFYFTNTGIGGTSVAVQFRKMKRRISVKAGRTLEVKIPFRQPSRHMNSCHTKLNI